MPKRITTDKLRSSGAAKREVAPSLDHWSHTGPITALETAICLSENESEQCKASDRRGAYSVSSPSSPQPEIVSLSRSAAALPSPSARGVEIHGKCPLINHGFANFQTQRVNVRPHPRGIATTDVVRLRDRDLASGFHQSQRPPVTRKQAGHITANLDDHDVKKPSLNRNRPHMRISKFCQNFGFLSTHPPTIRPEDICQIGILLM